MASYKKQMTRWDAEKLAKEFIEELNKIDIRKVEIAGSLRRKENWIGDIDLVCEGSLARLSQIPGLDIKRGQELVTAVYKDQQFNLLRSPFEEWGAALFYLTGPQKYTIAYRMKAKVKGWTLNQHGLFDQEGKKIAGDTEESIYKMFDKNWKAPEKRGKR